MGLPIFMGCLKIHATHEGLRLSKKSLSGGYYLLLQQIARIVRRVESF